MKKIVSIALLIAGGALLAGCQKKTNLHEPPTAGSQVSGSAEEGASTSANALGGDAASQGGDVTGANGVGPLARKVIYFDFDRSEIKPEFAQVISAHARNLTSHPNLKMKLEGNTDERGSREYNIGLGERRAQAVRRALMLQGVADSQIATVSYGEERPAVTGHTEEAWSRNRRVDIVYLN